MVRTPTRPLAALVALLTVACAGAPPPKAVPEFELFPLYPQYVGEQRGEGETGDVIHYWTDADRATHVLHVADGKLVDAAGRLLDAELETHPERNGFAMYVLGADGTIYYSFDHKAGYLHHSSLTAGQPVACAGDLTVILGELIDVNNGSGHYRPPPRALDNMALRLAQMGVDLRTVQVKYWGEPDRVPPTEAQTAPAD